MRKYQIALLGLAALGFALWLWPREVPTEDLPVIDIDVGEPMIHVMDRSTYDFRFKIIPPTSFSIPLAAHESKRDGHYFLRLRNGEQSVQFPWFPAFADIDVTAGQTEGLEVRFYNYPITVPENRGDMRSSGGGGLVVSDLAAERQAVIDVYFMLERLNMRRLEAACDPRHLNQTSPCNNPGVLPEKEWDAEDLGAEFDRFVTEWQAFWAGNDTKAKGKPPYYLMVARWMSDRGAVVSMHVEPRKDLVGDRVPLSQIRKTFVTQITIRNFYALRRAIHMQTCFGDIVGSGVLAGDIRYTLEQARMIYGAMLHDMGPLRSDEGRPMTDPVVLNDIVSRADRTLSRLIRNSWGDVPAGVDRGRPPLSGTPKWCAMVKDLEREAGYDGP